MNSIIPYQHPSQDLTGQNMAQEDRFQSVQETSVSAMERESLGLTLQTKEGDTVTLSAKSFSGFNAYTYDATGNILTENKAATAVVHQRTMTLISGSEFTFTVKGDLSDDELMDIQSIIATLDEIMGEMVSGDMETAFGLAVSMGDYDTVSAFEADLPVSRSYRMEAAAATSVDTGHRSGGNDRNKMSESRVRAEALMNSVMQELEKQDQALLKIAENPIGQLFDHYLETMEKEHKNVPGSIQARLLDILELLRQQMVELLAPKID